MAKKKKNAFYWAAVVLFTRRRRADVIEYINFFLFFSLSFFNETFSRSIYAVVGLMGILSRILLYYAIFTSKKWEELGDMSVHKEVNDEALLTDRPTMAKGLMPSSVLPPPNIAFSLD